MNSEVSSPARRAPRPDARAHHWALALSLAPGLALSPRRRALLRDMRAFCRALPRALAAPLPQAMQSITPAALAPVDPDLIRNLADLAALLERRSPLGLCLRRSLTRYHFLRRAGLPVAVQFGARFVGGQPDRDITGHAWLTLHDVPYHESGEDWQGFAIMYSYPPTEA
jgi:hypothetical protein